MSLALPERPRSPWLDRDTAAYPALGGDLEVDVAVVGGGITGLTTAVCLHRAGVRVALLEARHLGAAATGNTTAKISVLPQVLVATGFAKWGMSGGTAAGLALADHVLGRRRSWAPAFAADRVPRPRSLPRLASTNSSVARFMVTGWVSPDLPSSAPLSEGEGRVTTTARGKVARCRVDGVEHTVSAVCPHLGGIVAWNDAARSWDCPLHASRFAPDGQVLEGPVTAGLGAPPGLTRVIAPRG